MRKASEIVAVLKAGVWVCAVRGALWTMPLRKLWRVAEFLTDGVSKQNPHFSASQLSRAVSAASRYVPQATCLTQAIALHILLKRAGFQSRMSVGVARENGKFTSHAWVENQDTVVIGDTELQRYTPILVWD
jgi:hypothetical protein